MTTEKKIELIADRYGYEPQSRQCIEEMAELTQAINKYWRKRNFGGNDRQIAEADGRYLNYAVAVKVSSWFWRGTACKAN